jgi:preprotein translocase subunit SecD
MAVRKLITGIMVLGVAGALVWTGTKIQSYLYEDQCLDLGGGRNPGNFPICVVVQNDPNFLIGPIAITTNDIVSIKPGALSSGNRIVHLELKKEIAAALSGFTRHSIGQPMTMKIYGKTISSPIIREAIETSNYSIALPEPTAKDLIAHLSPS